MGEIKYSTLEDVKEAVRCALADLKEKGGLKRVYCVACGGSMSCFYPMVYFLKNEAINVSCELFTGNEFVLATPKALDENCLVFAMSLAGGTPETVNAAKTAQEHGATVITLSSLEEAPLNSCGDYHILYRIDTDYIIEESNQYVILAAALEVLNQTEGYAHYDSAVEGLKLIPGICTDALGAVAERADDWGERMKDEPVIYTMGSGPSQYVAYMECICMIMEMEWIHSNSINSGEYFHGPFEVTEDPVPFLVLEATGRTRYMDERAMKFLRQYSKKVELIDAEEFGIRKIDESCAEYFSPILLWTLAIRYTEGLGKAKNHPLLQRRYMYKVEY